VQKVCRSIDRGKRSSAWHSGAKVEHYVLDLFKCSGRHNVVVALSSFPQCMSCLANNEKKGQKLSIGSLVETSIHRSRVSIVPELLLKHRLGWTKGPELLWGAWGFALPGFVR